MPCDIFQVPPEIFHRIALFTTLASPLGPPKELLNCMLVCRTFWVRLLPKNASQLYFVIFAQKFDARGPTYRLTKDIVHEHAPLEMRRRFEAIHIFKKRMFDHPGLTEALWVAYLMVEDSDTSQKNIKQLLRVGTPTFLDSYLRSRLYNGVEDNAGWPIIDENISLAIALVWTLASPRVMCSEPPHSRTEMMRMLKPVIFASFRYSISFVSPDSFACADSRQSLTSMLNLSHSSYPISALPPREICYFGAVKRKARPPLAAIFATLLYFVRADTETNSQIPAHITCETRAEVIQQGLQGPCAEDFRHYFSHCRTRFADFPGIDVGIQSSSIATNPDTVLCQPSFYKLGSLTGQWQGSQIRFGIYDHPLTDSPAIFDNPSVYESRGPLYLTIQEHYCCDIRSIVPVNLRPHGFRNAWLPEDIVARQTSDGIEFTDANKSFHTTYTTHVGFESEFSSREQSPRVVDVIITAKTEDQYIAAWGGYTKIIGRVRLYDGLLALVQSNHDRVLGKMILSGYVTSSQNLVGRMYHYTDLGDVAAQYSSAFSLSKNHAGHSQFSPNKFM